jgi:hypothetical protein
MAVRTDTQYISVTFSFIFTHQIVSKHRLLISILDWARNSFTFWELLSREHRWVSVSVLTCLYKHICTSIYTSFHSFQSQYDSFACKTCSLFPQIFLCRKIGRWVCSWPGCASSSYLKPIKEENHLLFTNIIITHIENSVGGLIWCYISFLAF